MWDRETEYDSVETPHQALRGIRTELERHPVTTTVQGFPDDIFTEIVAQLETNRWGVTRENPTLTVRWFAGETADAPPQFSFHYSDSEADFGWHHEPNPRVDDWGHFQKQIADTGYAYEPYSVPHKASSASCFCGLSSVSKRLY